MAEARPKLTYHSDWFSEHESAYDSIVAPILAAKKEVKALVLGCYEGRSVEWLVGLPPKKADVVVIEEPLASMAKSKSTPRCVVTNGVGVSITDLDVRKTLKANLEALRRWRGSKIKIRLIEAHITAGLLEVANNSTNKKKKQPFDFILIDSLSSKHAMECAVIAFTTLRPGGIMAFTNYTHGKTHDASCPRRGIDGFLDAYVSEIRVLRTGFHLFLMRRERPFPLPIKCHAEVSDPFGPDPHPENACLKPVHSRPRRNDRSTSQA